MEKQYVKDPFVDGNNGSNNSNSNRNNSRGSNNRNNTRSNNGNNNSNRQNNNRRSGNNNSGGNQSNNSNRNNNNTGNNRRIQASDPCPLPGHGNHTWGECNQNRYGSHAQSAPGNQNNQRANTNANRNESNATEGSTNGSNGNGNGNSNQSTDSRRNRSNNGGNTNGSSNYFAELVDNAESFFFEDSYQAEFEPELYDDDSVADLPALIKPPIDDDSDSDDDDEPLVLDFEDNPDALRRGELVSSTVAVARKINEQAGKFLFRSLLDPGGSHVLVNQRSLPNDVETFEADFSFQTTAGSGNSSRYVYLHDIVLPEFSFTRNIKRIKAFVFDNPNVPYDIIFGRNFLNNCRIDVCGSSLTCKWYDLEIPFHPPGYFRDVETMRKVISVPPVRVEAMESHHVVTAAQSTQADIREVVASLTHLTTNQRNDLFNLLSRFEKLFDGTLGHYPKRKFHIDLKNDAVPYHCRQPYPCPQANRTVFKEELDRQEAEGTLERVYESEWGMPMFVIPKKNGTIRTVDDMRELNKQIKRKQYPLPKIKDIFHRRRGYKYFTKIDLTQCYYTYELDDESSWLCVLVTPFGKYRRKRLPMGLSQSPDWAQGALEEVLVDLLYECIEAYIDDVGCFSNSWEDHLKHLEQTLSLLQEAGYTVNPSKCEWAVQETEWLGHWLTPDGIRPLPSKIKGILAIAPPTTPKQVRSFLGMVNYYNDSFPRRAEILAPISALSHVSPSAFASHWTTECDEAFKKIKALIAQDVLLYYPDPNKKFIIEPDASKTQLGSVIYQLGDNGKRLPVAFFSRKLTPAQTRYPASDLEALCITETFEEYRSILLGAPIEVRTDHMNLTRRNLKSTRLLHWRLLLEEFAPEFTYLRGEDNVTADTLSRLPLDPSLIPNDNEIDDVLKESLLFYPTEVEDFPLTLENIQQQQQNDPAMLPLADDDAFELQTFNGLELISRRDANGHWRIVIPEALIHPTLVWYHGILGHAGTNRLATTIRNHLWFPSIDRRVQEFVNSCAICQHNKNPGMPYGHTAPREETSQPFSDIAVDLIGPWKIRVPNLGELSINAVTITDICTTLSEIQRIESKHSDHVAMQVENAWIARYPMPQRCIHDNGTEFTGLAFQTMLQRNGITGVPTTARNATGNAVSERVHKTVGDQLRCLIAEHPPTDVPQALDLIDNCLSSVTRALRTSIHRTFQISPGALVFQRDMLLPIPIMADHNLIRQRRQTIIDDNNHRANLRRRFHDYSIGDQVLLLHRQKAKMAPKAIGPYTVLQDHVNGTLTIQRGLGIEERVNIRRVKPYTA